MSRSAVLAIVGLLALPFLTGCAVGRLDAVPSALAGDLSFASVQNARFSGDDGSSLADEMFRSIAHERATGAKPGPWSFLALSGGQEDGAFGAGLLVGWSRHGGRPQFKIVTGTSTGALAAPFAFLGSEYDATLEQMYTTTGTDDVVSLRYLTVAVNGDALGDSSPLYASICKYMTPEVLRRIGQEYQKGRLLLISTANLDSGKLVIWNIGAIAASDNPTKLRLVRKILLASAAVPGLFPPVMLDALLDNEKHQEMHVDGGTVSQVFLYPPSTKMAELIAKNGGSATAYIIRNGRPAPDAKRIERQTLAIASRAIETMVSSNAVGELYRIYATTQRDGIAFKAALIGDDFTEPYREAFDQHYMAKLFEYGRAKGAQGYAWRTTPPDFDKPSTH